MKILIIHNHYQNRGGEDVVVEQEAKLLMSHGHAVELLECDNNGIRGFRAVSAALEATYSPASRKLLRRRIDHVRPDIIHVHNFFPRFSPSIYYACLDKGVPVVQTLHNYRLICPGATLYREGRPCEDCVGRKLPWPGIIHACYRSNRPASAAVAAMIASHRLLGTWAKSVDVYIALTEFCRNKMAEGGIPVDKIHKKPNFVAGQPLQGDGAGGFALFVGRLSPEKGISILLQAWKDLAKGVPLIVVGDGPMANDVRKAAAIVPGIEFRGWLPQATVRELMRSASFLVFPSLWYEGFPLTIAEAFAAGLPVIASDHGSLNEIVQHEATGLLFEPGNALALKLAAQQMFTSPALAREMRANCRREYETKYTPECNYRLLAEIYSGILS